MRVISVLVLLASFSALLPSAKGQNLMEINFINGSSETDAILWSNFIGISVSHEVTGDSVFNNTLFQAYQLNSRLEGRWSNIWTISIKNPLGLKYDCSRLESTFTNGETIVCNSQTKGNETYWSVLGEYIWNTAPQPKWCIGYDMEGTDMTVKEHRDLYYDWILEIYDATYGQFFCVEAVDFGNLMVERGYKASYTPDDFLSDIEEAINRVYSIAHSGPGITDDADGAWLASYDQFSQLSWNGKFTVRCVVFSDPTQVTVEKILSDNATKYYLQSRFTVNESLSYTTFGIDYLSISDIKLTEGDGVDGVTNTFAAAIWLVDIALEFCLMQGYDISFNYDIYSGNNQAVLGVAPDFKPTPLYYGMMLVTMIRNLSPKLIIPAQVSGLSLKIKAFGFEYTDFYQVLLLNKDSNTSLNGTVKVKLPFSSEMFCFTMEAPSLESTDNVTLSGYHFVGGNATPQGSFSSFKVRRQVGSDGYEVPIKYAQAVLCKVSSTGDVWPTGSSQQNYGRALNVGISALIFTCFVLCL